jgi:hypothetical protein
MVAALLFSQVVLIALVWLCLLRPWAGSSDPAACPTTPGAFSALPKGKREPPPVAGLPHKPPSEAGEPTPDLARQAPAAPPPRLVPLRGRRRQVPPATHFCPRSSPPTPVNQVRQQTRHFAGMGGQLLRVVYSLPVRPA